MTVVRTAPRRVDRSLEHDGELRGAVELLRGAKVGEALLAGVDVEREPEACVVRKRPRRRVALGVACAASVGLRAKRKAARRPLRPLQQASPRQLKQHEATERLGLSTQHREAVLAAQHAVLVARAQFVCRRAGARRFEHCRLAAVGCPRPAHHRRPVLLEVGRTGGQQEVGLQRQHRAEVARLDPLAAKVDEGDAVRGRRQERGEHVVVGAERAAHLGHEVGTDAVRSDGARLGVGVEEAEVGSHEREVWPPLRGVLLMLGPCGPLWRRRRGGTAQAAVPRRRPEPRARLVSRAKEDAVLRASRLGQ
eukprot:scaffold49007_cov75-Phaeocystis_antarctica.AAC.3